MVIHNWLSSVQRFLNRPRHPRRSRRQGLDNGHARGLRDLRPAAVECLEERTLLSGMAVLVKDINLLPGTFGTADSGPSNPININGTLFFTASDGVNGNELWKSDGTTAGTVLVRDINPGSGSSSPANLTNVGGTLFFSATDVINGLELWKSDGTTAGTMLVKDITTGGNPSYPSSLTNVGGTLFFRAVVPNEGFGRLWKSDGTVAGTVRVTNSPVSGYYPALGVGNLTNVNGTLFFTATDNFQLHGQELWKSDGTALGTVMVKDINTSGYSSPSHLTNVNGTLFFRATDGINGVELWKSDGTEAGTVLVKDIKPGSASSIPPTSNYRPEMINVGGTLFFEADDGINGAELWKSDGTTVGTVLVKDIVAGSGTSVAYPGGERTNVGGTLFFTANDGINGNELWKSDGTTAGTVVVKDFNPGSLSSMPSTGGKLTNSGGKLFFFAFGDANTNASGLNGLWESDGTAAGTVLAANLALLTSFPGGTPVGRNLTDVNGHLFFTATDEAHGNELWQYIPGPPNQNPVITSSATPSVAENTTAVTTVIATDADLPAQTVTFSLSGGADAARFLITSGGVLTFATAPDFENPADAGANNVYNVQVTANDGNGGLTAQNIAVTVTSVNDNSPVFTSLTTFNVPENTIAVGTTVATDADLPAQSVNFAVTGGADAARFLITSGGVLTFATAPDFENPADAGANNVYDVQVTANDGNGGLTVQNIAVTVNAVDQFGVRLAVTTSINTRSATPLDKNAALINVDPNASFSNAKITVSITPSVNKADNNKSDRLSVLKGSVGGIKVAGSNITLNGVKIAKISGGTSGRPLVITFLQNGNADAVNAVLKRISAQAGRTSKSYPKQLPRLITVSINVAGETHSATTTATVP